MKKLPAVDVAIIGAGWTGLTMAKELATRTGLKILVLERGGPRETRDYLDNMDELDYAVRLRMMQPIRDETVTFRHAPRDRALPVRQYGSFLPGTGVGGSGEHWSGISYRYYPHDFRRLSHIVEKYGHSRLPEDCTVRDWPITYGDLEPYYERAERLMGISGKAGNLNGRRIDGGNVFEGPRQSEYPTPPMKMPHLAALFREAAQTLGYHPFPLPAATTSVPYTNPDGVRRAGCSFCGYCERFGCMVGAKAQPTNTLMPILAHHPNFELRTGAWVRRIVVEGRLAQGVQYADARGEECLQPAGLVFLASWTLNNTRLLLLSRIGEPYDPDTGRGTLGSNLTHQVTVPAATVFFDKPLNSFMGAGSAGVAIGDFDALDHSHLDFVTGGALYTVCYGTRPIANFGALPPSVHGPNWGSEWKKAALNFYDRTGSVRFYGEHLAYRANYMDLDTVYKDRWGDPLLRMTLDWHENERRLVDYITPRALEIAKALGAVETAPFTGLKRYDATRYQGTHVQGGTIVGANETQSVVNRYLQHWRVANLFVLGASAFPQNPSGNPTLTAVALTYRTADAVVEKFLKHPGDLA
ncbi:MAG TPA: GMC family oxidoreductase [Bryobacteraceae bacterium]|nr:GMC family oxidoreductase [Bryobacteraceae bacterium]